MIEPALTPEDWGEAQEHSTGEVTVRDVNDVSVFNGADRPKMAALCLHGLITWEMVDALRDGADTIRIELGGDDLVHKKLLGIADLLESLLPPRAP